LEQALASGARSGRADVIALAYQVGIDDSDQRQWAPIGIYVYIAEMETNDSGRALFNTRLEFIPDASRLTLQLN
jgi:hypothetical protein